MSSRRESDESTEQTRSTRALVLPSPDTEAVPALAPARGTTAESGRAKPPYEPESAPSSPTATATPTATESGPAGGSTAGSDAEAADGRKEAATRPRSAKTGDRPDERAEAKRDRAGRGGIAAAATGDEPPQPSVGVGEQPPGRPKKAMLAAAAIGGAVLLGAAFLAAGAGPDKDNEKHQNIGADKILKGDGKSGKFGSEPGHDSPSEKGKKGSGKSSESGDPEKSTDGGDDQSADSGGKDGDSEGSDGHPHKPKEYDKSSKMRRVAAASVASVFGGAPNVQLQNLASGQCADLPNFGKGSVNGPVNQHKCNRGGGDNQMWNLKLTQQHKGPGGANLFTIRNNKDNLCMDLPGLQAQSAGTKVAESACKPGADRNQVWYISPGQENRYQIHNSASRGLCLVPGGPSANGDARLTVGKCGVKASSWSWD